jgi:predicted Ser/Thr protein kinase
VTDGFRQEIGKGGFGSVYLGSLEDGTQVAVKLRSESSNQGVQEFLAEVRFTHAKQVFVSNLVVH